MNYAYNNKPDETKLTGNAVDFVDQFLFELMEGYCDYFSTSMAVMARSLGMPARWVKGFAPGVLPASAYGPPGDYYMEEEINPTGSGTYTVRNSDAHSWVEIYFEGFGWVPFEATAGFSFPYTFAEEEEAALPEVDDSTEVEAADEADTSSFNVKPILWIATALVVLAAGILLYVRRERMIASWHRLRHGSYTNNDQIVIETHRLLRLCKKRGLVREEHETLREAIMRWSQSQKRLREDFRFVLNGFERAKYSSVLATSEETEHFVSKVRALIEELK
ncbi:Protein-glutamine gamma-glutamyltransferase [compost metagenome]